MRYTGKPLPPPRTPNYIDVNKRMKILDTGKLSLDVKEINALELLVKTMSAGKAHFTSNVMAIVGEGIREAEINVFGNKVKTLIPRHIDKIVKSHNTISQNALNETLFVWVYGSVTGNNPPLYVQSGTGSLVFVESSGQQVSFSPAVLALPNGQSTFTFLFLVNDTSTNSYTATQEQLFPMVLRGGNTGDNFQLANPFSTANLVISKSSNQILSFIWAVQMNLSGGVSGNGLIGLFSPLSIPNQGGYYGSYLGPVGPNLKAFSGSTTYFNAGASYYYINVNGILYAVAIATDTSSNSYTPSSILAYYWGFDTNYTDVALLSVTTPPNAPGTKASYASVSWYNAFYLTT